MSIERGREYLLSLHARVEGFKGPLIVTLEKQGGAVLASATINKVGADWQKFETRLQAKASDTNARLVIAAAQTGTVWLDMVSLFPHETFKNRPNGMRREVAEMIAEMRPAFLRFPGGCFVEGDTLRDAFRWKETLGDIAERPGRWCLWGYRSTDGLGFYEYLQFCEDVGAEPLFVANCGLSHAEQRASMSINPTFQKEFVEDALDAIEYANGPTDSKWGSVRAKAGHPEPFGLKYLQIGNENFGPLYDDRYKVFYDAIKGRYPEVQVIACDWKGGIPRNRPVDLIDSHWYADAEAYFDGATRYDSYDRRGPRVYLGEYAVTRGAGKGNLQAAVAEGAMLTGLERNSDVVRMVSYAPLLERVGWNAWSPNAIRFNNRQVFGTPSYHVQKMFAENRPETVLRATVSEPVLTAPPLKGRISVGTWATQAEFKEIKVTGKDGRKLLEGDLSAGLAEWRTVKGQWEAVNGAAIQKGEETDARLVTGNAEWSDYTVALKARKTGGGEGFLVGFGLKTDRAKSYWNLGGWGNTAHGVEIDGIETAATKVPGMIETGRWYDLRIELKGESIRCYLDGKLIHDLTRPGKPRLFATAGRKGKELILKVVNGAAEARDVDFALPRRRPSRRRER